MPTISLIRPLDQPLGSRRLLGDLKACFATQELDQLHIVVAFAQSGPLLRLKDALIAWRAAGKRVEAVFGIDHQGTSRQALELGLTLFDRLYVTREPGITFHPKIYDFRGPGSARIFVGSNNLTVGGTETNFETAIELALELPADAATATPFDQAWSDLLPPACPATTLLDAAALAGFVDQGFVPDETSRRARSSPGGADAIPVMPKGARSGLPIKPASPLPKRVLAKPGTGPAAGAAAAAPAPVAAGGVGAGAVAAAQPGPTAAHGFAIQIKPHHNGEIFLSVTAALQNPPFFAWPFNGLTTPKKAGNPSYPQRAPDPRVDISVYGAGRSPLLELTDYALNTVYYATKSEIRITASPLVGVVPDYSVMVMTRNTNPDRDYEIVIHTPASPDYGDWVAACDQQMPGGGQAPRRFGWF